MYRQTGFHGSLGRNQYRSWTGPLYQVGPKLNSALGPIPKLVPNPIFFIGMNLRIIRELNIRLHLVSSRNNTMTTKMMNHLFLYESKGEPNYGWSKILL